MYWHQHSFSFKPTRPHWLGWFFKFSNISCCFWELLQGSWLLPHCLCRPLLCRCCYLNCVKIPQLSQMIIVQTVTTKSQLHYKEQLAQCQKLTSVVTLWGAQTTSQSRRYHCVLWYTDLLYTTDFCSHFTKGLLLQCSGVIQVWLKAQIHWDQTWRGHLNINF